MKSTSVTPIGLIIDLLGISVGELASEIYIDRTTISKWKHNTRPFGINSEYYEATVNFILNFNDKQGLKLLESFFESLYGEDCDDGLRKSVDIFLNGKYISSRAHGIMDLMKGKLYTHQISIYMGTHGRKTAMNSLLSEMQECKEPTELTLFDAQQFEWLLNDPEYFEEWNSTILTLLKRGHQIFVIMQSGLGNAMLKTFYERNYELYGYSGYKQRNFSLGINMDLLSSAYLLKDKLYVQGRCNDNNYYTAIFRDKITLNQGEKYLKMLEEGCQHVISPKTLPERLDFYKKLGKGGETEETGYMLANKPSFLTMSEELFEKVLKDNKISSELKKGIVEMYHTVRREYKNSGEESAKKHIIYYPFLRKSIFEERIYHHELSALLGKEIFLTNEQYRTHIQDTVDILRDFPNYQIGLAMNWIYQLSEQYFFVCKKNFYSLSLNGYISFTLDSEIVNVLCSIFDESWRRNISLEYKSKEFVCQKLLELAQMKEN